MPKPSVNEAGARTDGVKSRRFKNDQVVSVSGPFACERRLALRKTSALALHWCIAARAWHPVFISWNSKLVLNLLQWCCQPGAPCLPTIGNRSAPIATRAVGGQNAKSKERRGRCNGALLHPYLVDRRLGVPFGCVCSFCCPLSVSFLIITVEILPSVSPTLCHAFAFGPRRRAIVVAILACIPRMQGWHTRRLSLRAKHHQELEDAKCGSL